MWQTCRRGVPRCLFSGPRHEPFPEPVKVNVSQRYKSTTQHSTTQHSTPHHTTAEHSTAPKMRTKKIRNQLRNRGPAGMRVYKKSQSEIVAQFIFTG